MTETAPRPGRVQRPSVERLALAVALLAEDRQTDAQIAAALGIARRTLARWKRHPLYSPMYRAVAAYYRLQLEREWEAERRAEEAAYQQAAAARPARRRRRSVAQNRTQSDRAADYRGWRSVAQNFAGWGISPPP